MKFLLVPAAMASGLVLAQTPVTEFPERSTPLAADTLKAAISDKVFMAKPAAGNPWRLQYNANGYFYVNVGNFADGGKWSVKDSTVCTEGRQIRYFCNEFQIKDGLLYMKRESGEVLRLDPM